MPRQTKHVANGVGFSGFTGFGHFDRECLSELQLEVSYVSLAVVDDALWSIERALTGAQATYR